MLIPARLARPVDVFLSKLLTTPSALMQIVESGEKRRATSEGKNYSTINHIPKKCNKVRSASAINAREAR